MKTILFFIGTRPEAIKIAPLILECKKRKDIRIQVCSTEQHIELLHPILNFFDIKPDYSLQVMDTNQTLTSLTTSLLNKSGNLLSKTKPDMVVVQGDTTTAMTSALASFYQQIPIAHVEAGLRSFNKQSPFPEEANRKIISTVADLHFPPTQKAQDNLETEGIVKHHPIVGNTVIDALDYGLDIIKNKQSKEIVNFFLNKKIDTTKEFILVTSHRRENFGEPFKQICNALKRIALLYPDTRIVYPVHLNPNVQNQVYKLLDNQSNITLIDPLNYPHLIYLMKHCKIILTDSGGIQEEAPSLGKPVIVLRELTERTEGIDAGTALLAGTNENKIVSLVQFLLDNPENYKNIAQKNNPYGDGKSAKLIIDYIQKWLK
ncbi:UDP-N-acetylglucosamine 2-epimerase (non-hydrolyzing) [Candidatus Marinamargulisbacteria bacterium SCGC AAA071-K20]|nr:UDP-N-acetylglucosamine 2-epimerase (non-hydrolyzing) [Candidatus Marinamargulisbacteria bacterium SCGC AAA071-K20]